MQLSTHILLYFLVVCLAIVDRGAAENKQSIASAEFLSVLAKNVATVLSPTLVGELQDGRPNRTAVNATNVQSIPTTSTTPKVSDTTREPFRLLNLEADTVRSAQTQAEVGTGNRGFPFNYDDNFRYNYQGINGQGINSHGINAQGINSPGINSQGINSPGLQRPDFPSGGPFGHPGYYNPDIYRNYPPQSAPDRSPRPEENIPQRGESPAGVPGVENVGNDQSGRALDSLDPSSANFDRFRNLERFPFNGQFPGGQGNFQNFPFSPERLQDGRFNDGRFSDGRFNPYNTNLPDNGNLPGSLNFQNGLRNNFPRNNFQSLGDPFQQRQHAHGSNSFDFSPSQRFQNPFDNYPRSLQRGPNLPGFYSPPYAPGLRDFEALPTPAPKKDAKKIEQASSSELKVKSEKLDAISEQNSPDTVATENPQVLSIAGQIRFGNLFLPTLEDYSDVRFRPDAFRQYLFTPNKKEDDKNDKDNKDTKETKDKNDKINKNKNIITKNVNNNNNATSETINDV